MLNIIKGFVTPTVTELKTNVVLNTITHKAVDITHNDKELSPDYISAMDVIEQYFSK